MFRYLLVLVALLCFRQGKAQTTDQNYPVTAQAFVVAQPNQKLAAYFASNQALTVSLLLKDLTKTSIQAYLRWSIDGPGVHLSSIDGNIPMHFITLQRGVMQRLSGLELQSDYFLSNLILAEGLAGPPLRTSLPEGFYTFRVQALEAGTGREVSNWGETYFSITTPLPPVINIPFNGAELTPTEAQKNGVQPVSIQWMPRHYKLPGHITSYDLKVCKVPEGYEPTEALDACVSPIIDDRGNPGTFFPSNTGIGNSIIGAFEIGVKYAVRVTIHEFDENGDEILFANEGRSEVTWFRFGKLCVSPAAFAIKEVGPGRLQLTWEQLDGVDSYTIHYRKTGDLQWKKTTTSSPSTVLSGLAIGTYEISVQSGCSVEMPSSVQIYTIGQEEEPEKPSAGNPFLTKVTISGDSSGIPDSFNDLLNPNHPDALKLPCASQISSYENCEAGHPVIIPSGTIPLPVLQVGDVLTVYDMAVLVTGVNGSNPLSGTGLARMPFLQGTNGAVPLTPVEFSGVKAWKAENGASGGCVYQVDGYFRSRNATATSIAQEQTAVLKALQPKTDSTSTSSGTFTGTLEEALIAYDSLHTLLAGGNGNTQVQQELDAVKDAIVKATGEWKEQLTTQYPDTSAGHTRAVEILASLDSLNTQITNGSLVGAEKAYKDALSDFNHPAPTILPFTPDAPTLSGPTIARLGSCTKNGAGYDPLTTPGTDGLACLGELNDIPYWTYKENNETWYLIAQANPDGSYTYARASETAWVACGRSPMNLCADTWQTVQLPEGENNETPDPLLPSISQVIANPVGSQTATINWQGGPAFAKYIIKYKDPSGAEQQETVTATKVNLARLAANSNYTFIIEGYDAAGTLLNTYSNGAFSTTTEQLAMPKNVLVVKNGSGRVSITWDKNVTHLSFKLIYQDQAGKEYTVHPTTNNVIISGLDSNQVYPFTLTAVGRNGSGEEIFSDPVNSYFSLASSFALRIGIDDGGTNEDEDNPDNADDFDDGRDLNEVVVIGQAEWTASLDVSSGYYDETSMEDWTSILDNATNTPAPVVNPEGTMVKVWKKRTSFKDFVITQCPDWARNNSVLRNLFYVGHLIGELFVGLGHVVQATGEFIIDDVFSPLADGAIKLMSSILEKVNGILDVQPELSVDDVFEQVALRQTIVEFPFDTLTNRFADISTKCAPVPSWIKNISECELILIKEYNNSPNLPILIVDKNGNPTNIVDAKETDSGDYYYKHPISGAEYWKINGTYLIARINGTNWTYWNAVLNLWCGFTPTKFNLRTIESVGMCQTGQDIKLGGEIKVQVFGGKGPYEFGLDNLPPIISESPVFTYDSLGVALHDLKVKDSKGCVAMLGRVFLRPLSSLSLIAKLRKCNNSVVLEAMCGYGPYSFSMDGVNYQSSPEFTGIQQMIAPPNACTNGVSKEFTFYVKDAQGQKTQTTITIKRNDYFTMEWWPSIIQPRNQVFCGVDRGAPESVHINKSSAVEITHRDKFCDDVKGLIRITSMAGSVSAPPYTYSITGMGVNKTVMTESGDYKFDNLEPGNYYISGSDGNGCEVESMYHTEYIHDSRNVKIVDAGLEMTVQAKNPICGDERGTISLNVKGGASRFHNYYTSYQSIPNRYLFVNGEYLRDLQTPNNSQPSLQLSKNFPTANFTFYQLPGNYDIKVTDYLGCSVEEKVVLSAPRPLLITTKILPATAQSGPSVTVSASGDAPPFQYVLARPEVPEIRQTNGDFTNLNTGFHIFRVEDAKGCSTQKSLIIGQPLSLFANVVRPNCVNKVKVSLVASGGVLPFQYSVNGSSFQDSGIFENLGVGTYVFTVKDSQNSTTSTTVTISAQPDTMVVPSMYVSPAVISTNARTSSEEGFFEVQYDESSQKNSFKLEPGFDLKPNSSGLWALTVTSSDPNVKMLEGNYRQYFNGCDQNVFVGFYKENFISPSCAESGRVDQEGNQYCQEGWLPETHYWKSNGYVVCNGTNRGVITFIDNVSVSKQHPVWTINGKQYQAFWIANEFWRFIEKEKLPDSTSDWTKYAVMEALPYLNPSQIKSITYTTVTACNEANDTVESGGKTIEESGSKFTLKEDANGNITVEGNWKPFAKCPTCPQIAEELLQKALQKARDKNNGKLTEETRVVEQQTIGYGSLPGGIVYNEMNLGAILKNMAQTYNSLLEHAKVPAEAWEPEKDFFVRDETAVISGALDQAIEEARDIPDLVGLGLTLFSDPTGASEQLSSFRQQLSWEKAGDMSKEFGKSLVFADEFEKGGKYAWHGTGRVGVVIGKAVISGGMLAILKDAPGQLKKRLDDIADLFNEVKGRLKNLDLADELEKSLGNEDFFNALKADKDLLECWEALKAYPKLRLDPSFLQKAKGILAKGHISFDDLQTMLTVNSGLGARATDLANFFDDLDHLALYKGQSGFESIVGGLKADWFNGAGADGANWVIAALRKEGTDIFPPGSTSFEVTKNFDGASRRYDAIVSEVGQSPKFYEFKSHRSVPPSDFAEQFLKDLNNPDITDLSQLKWLFDAAKNPANFEANMKAAIDALAIDDLVAQKLGFSDSRALKNGLRTEFGTIFLLK